MWVFTTTGYLSLVENQDDKSTIIVRARVRGDMNRFREQYLHVPAIITYHENNDYPYRMIVPKGEIAKAVAAAVMDIDYKNFKSEVHEVQGGYRASVYTRIWGVLIDLEGNRRRIRKYFQK